MPETGKGRKTAVKYLSKRNIFYSQEDSMGGWSSKPEPKNDKPSFSTTAPTIASRPCSQEPTKVWFLTRSAPGREIPQEIHESPQLINKRIQHLVLAFFVGVLLTLLLLVLVFLIVKTYRKCHSSPWARDPPLDSHSSRDPPAKLSSPEEALTYASVAFKTLEEKSEHLTEKRSAPLDTVVYAPVKGTDSPYLSSEA
ncbi:transmembrane protein C1orf162 homolog isoform X1 [Enhydra lutris kenyoni]|uniref:Transmembrane protein C1orf162 homolog isoform X1 n=2 Tax=Enhydra lutris kenyoni TaxID=391180 RepID=A0A2Y9IWT1_ENHLU|nr:transmembrane protein C1orf162 homolog isoform X1 [Enhydra lutris kenyoni]XP_022352823.1 transmembrane protein C1orf162 homolog isoform X1 [Enhydra lutris kenyoni]XP_022352824.1 transmembrane protein C1orf162 homolog isoform X1 [Enhydra lutris kenyoni]XP_022352826.1 transmembrane protein C1orf162 homolog isoform X1 [Enhydra lutris kenyoni]